MSYMIYVPSKCGYDRLGEPIRGQIFPRTGFDPSAPPPPARRAKPVRVRERLERSKVLLLHDSRDTLERLTGTKRATSGVLRAEGREKTVCTTTLIVSPLFF